MPDQSLSASPISFEDLRKTNEHGADFWSARDMQPLLGYSQWRRFEDAIGRATISCTQSGNPADYHFAGAGKMIATGKGAAREVADYHLSRFACYLIAQNGDPRKPAPENLLSRRQRNILRSRLGGKSCQMNCRQTLSG